MTALALATAFTGAFAGALGSWSPCGFSMVATLSGPTRDSRPRLAAACATFAAGTTLGGTAAFTAFSAVGALVHRPLGGSGALTLACALAVTGAVLEARRLPIRPQIRRQVPEPWRRSLPLPLASALYGILLGLGFTTFVMSWAYWALAGVSIALASPTVGLAAGIGFGLGRALPVVALAPVAERPLGLRALELMGERPAVLASARITSALSLVALAAVLLTAPAAPAGAAVLATPATDPSADQGDVAWQVPGGSGLLLRNGQRLALPGTNPSLGGPYLALRQTDHITLLDRTSLQPLTSIPAPGADVLAVSASWLVYRRVSGGVDELHAVPLPAGSPDRVIATRQTPDWLGRPSLDNNLLAFATSTVDRSTIELVDLSGAAPPRTLLRSTLSQFVNPALQGQNLLFERLTYCAQQVRLAPVTRPHHSHLILALGTLARRDPGYSPGHSHVGSRASHCPRRHRRRSALALWTTALGPAAAYVTELDNLHPGSAPPRIVAASL